MHDNTTGAESISFNVIGWRKTSARATLLSSRTNAISVWCGVHVCVTHATFQGVQTSGKQIHVPTTRITVGMHRCATQLFEFPLFAARLRLRGFRRRPRFPVFAPPTTADPGGTYPEVPGAALFTARVVDWPYRPPRCREPPREELLKPRPPALPLLY